MAQQLKVTTEESIERAWNRIGHSEWDQMVWLVKLANTSDFETLSAGELLLWQEEFMAMFLRGHGPVIKTPLDHKRYPRSDGPKATFLEWPTPAEMLRIRDAIKRPIEDLADGRGTWIPEGGSFDVSYSVKFMGNPEYSEKPNTEPRYLVDRNESSGVGSSYQQRFMLRLLCLLEAYPDKNRRSICADKLRRCSYCPKVFLQVKRSSRYCSRGCYTVAGMRRLRGERKAKLAVKKVRRAPVHRARRKGRARRG